MQQMPITRFESAICRSSFIAWLCERKHQQFLLNVAQFAHCSDLQLFDWFRLIQRTPIVRFESAIRCYYLRCRIATLGANIGNSYWTSHHMQTVQNFDCYGWFCMTQWTKKPSAIHWSNFVAWLCPLSANIGNWFWMSHHMQTVLILEYSDSCELIQRTPITRFESAIRCFKGCCLNVALNANSSEFHVILSDPANANNQQFVGAVLLFFWNLVDPMNANHAIRIGNSLFQFSCLIARVSAIRSIVWRKSRWHRHFSKPFSHCTFCSLGMDSYWCFDLLGV